MNRTTILLLLSLLPLVASAQIQRIGVGELKFSASVAAAAEANGTANEMGRILDALTGQLTSALVNTRKFEVVARADLDAILQEQGFAASGNVDYSDPQAAQQFEIAGIKYLLVPTIDDFQDYTESMQFANLGREVTRRIIRLSAVLNIYDTTTGVILDSPNVQLRNESVLDQNAGVASTGRISDSLLLEIAREMAEKSAQRVVDVIYPAKILRKTAQQVTINRGDGTGIERGQIWAVFFVGDELIDPDTGISLGREEYEIGKVRITRVNPQFSLAEVVGDDNGIAAGQVVRLDEPME